MLTVGQKIKIISLVRQHSANLEIDSIILRDSFNSLKLVEESLVVSRDSRYKQNLLEISAYVRQENVGEFAKEVTAVFLLLTDSINNSLSTEEKKYLSSFYTRAIDGHRDDSKFGLWAQLSESELNQLKSFTEKNDDLYDDIELIKHAENLLETQIDRRSGFGARFDRELRVLIETLKTSSNDEKISMARKGLIYVFRNDDVIPDELGMLGLIDDMCVVRAVSSYLSPNLTKISDDIEKMLARAPFLKDIFWTQKNNKNRVTGLSDFTLQIFNPIYRVFNEHLDPQRLYILNHCDTSSIANLIARIASIATYAFPAIHNPVIGDINYKINDLVAVDLKNVSYFDGFISRNGKDFLNLRSERMQKGQICNTWQQIEVEQSGRVHRAINNRTAKGFANRVMSSDSRNVSPLENIFHTKAFPFVKKSAKRVFLVTSIVEFEKFENEYSLSGVEFSEAVPTAKLSRDMELEGLTGVVDPSEARLIVVPTIDRLVDFEFDQGTKEDDIVIIDLDSQNNNVTSLVELDHSDMNIFVFGADIAYENSRLFLDESYKFIIWGKKKLRALANNDDDSFIWEKKSRKQIDLKITSELIECAEAEELFGVLKEVESLALNYTDNYEYDEIKLKIARLLKQMFSFCSLNENLGDFMAILEEKLKEIDAFSKKSLYIGTEVKDLVESFCDFCQRNTALIINAKSNSIRDLLGEYELVNFTPSLLGGTKKTFEGKNILFSNWPTKSILRKIIKEETLESVHLVLFRFELKWLKAFMISSEISKDVMNEVDERYSHLLDESSLLKQMPDFIEIHDIEQKIRIKRAKSRVIESDSEEKSSRPDRLFLCSDNAEVYATNKSHFVVARGQDENFEISEVTGSAVKNGDMLVFLPYSDSSAIRVLADKDLDDAARSKAKDWQRLIREKLNQNNISQDIFRNRLASKGIQRAKITISNWINDTEMVAPMSFKKVIPTIFEALEIVADCDDIFNAIDDVYSAHANAARSIRAKLKSSMSSGFSSNSDFEIYHVEVVEAVNNISIPYSKLSKPLRF